VNLPDTPAILRAYEKAVLALLDVIDKEDMTEEDAEAFVNAMVDLIFTTMQTYLTERDQNGTDHH
jgi:hypothetical protein